MNILLISPYFRPAVGGVETHLDDLTKYLVSRKHRVFVRTYKALSTSDRGLSQEISKNLQINRMNWPDFSLNIKLEKWPVARFLYVFTGLFLDVFVFMIKNSKSIDVIQVHGFIASVIGVLLKIIFNKRVVVNTHVGFSFKNSSTLINLITKWTLKKSDKVLVLTNNSKSELISIGLPEEKIQIYHYWVDQNKFKPFKNIKTNTLNALFIGRLVQQKGIDRIFKLAEEFYKINFTIVGSGPMEDFIRGKLEECPNIKFLGKISNEKLTNIYNQSSFLIVPSQSVDQTYEEGIPRVIIESLSCGKPVLTTSTGGIPDVFNSEMGLITPDDYSGFKKGFILMTKNYNNFKKCRNVAEKLFSTKNAEIIERSLV